MAKWGLHLEGDKYVVREGYVARRVAGAKVGEEGAGQEGKVVDTFPTRAAAASKIRELEAKRMDARTKNLRGK